MSGHTETSAPTATLSQRQSLALHVIFIHIVLYVYANSHRFCAASEEMQPSISPCAYSPDRGSDSDGYIKHRHPTLSFSLHLNGNECHLFGIGSISQQWRVIILEPLFAVAFSIHFFANVLHWLFTFVSPVCDV